MIQDLQISQIVAGNNDRTRFDQAALLELADSIREHGLAQPITVRLVGNVYQVVAGERRLRAIRDILGRETIPAIVRDLNDEAASAIMLAENVARADLDPIDEARAYQARMDAYGWTVKDCATQAGVSSVRVKFRLKLLRLRPELQDLVRNGDLPLGYAQILSDADLDTNRKMLALARLRDNPRPTPMWFRKEVNRLREAQCQESLFDTAFFTVQEASTEKATFEEPPHPSTTTPPVEGEAPRAKMVNQITFWQKAAEAWDALGKPFKRQECEAAVSALTMALAVII
jgi:ParB/RepB/Spo0J family partition protein